MRRRLEALVTRNPKPGTTNSKEGASSVGLGGRNLTVLGFRAWAFKEACIQSSGFCFCLGHSPL